MTVHRLQEVVFEGVALSIPLRGFFAQGHGYPTESRAPSLEGLFIVLPDNAVHNREEEKALLNDAFRPLLEATKAVDDMRARAPSTVEVDTFGRILRYATLWES